ncbi:hypothetical protein JOE25_004534 [Serratia sp. PL17]|uniref:hypothetical protein n=1 Tax=Serratia TaxID=613 RepID=UPI001AE36D19|nr:MULTISPECIES: hypothetical protein [Serratia]MBP1132928.1 hypothetical protein [Serratia sp. PL17]CAI0742051.1 Uncharacterised protein [Serratia grimesii]
MKLTTERLREIAERRSPSLRWGEAEKIATELLATRETQPVGYTSAAALDLLSHGQAALIHKDAETTTFIEEEYRDVVPLFTYAPAVASGENCWSCGKFFTYAQHSECDGYCPHCEAPVDLDEGEEGTAPPAPAVPPEVQSVRYLKKFSGVCVIEQQPNFTIYAPIYTTPPAPAVPGKIGIQEAKELFNYLMTEEELNATVNGYNACRAEMLAQPVSQGYTLNSPEIPDGWKMVPNEPTTKQWAAGRKAMDGGIDKVTLAYRAMVEVAPPPGGSDDSHTTAT